MSYSEDEEYSFPPHKKVRILLNFITLPVHSLAVWARGCHIASEGFPVLPGTLNDI